MWHSLGLIWVNDDAWYWFTKNYEDTEAIVTYDFNLKDFMQNLSIKVQNKKKIKKRGMVLGFLVCGVCN